MIQSLILAVGGIVTMMMVWILIQSAWRGVFSDHINDDDVLAERTSCANCNCKTICNRKKKALEKNSF